MTTPFINLRNIDLHLIDQKYDFISYKEKNKTEQKKKQTKTKISDITKDDQRQAYFSFIDEAKKDHICVMTMRDAIQNEKLPEKTDICCFWCRHSFTTRPIGCPLHYKSMRLYKKYYSEITKNNYCLQQSICSNQIENTNDQNDENFFTLEISPSNYYLVDGIFCSFNCCYAFILEQQPNPIYQQSEVLLKRMYYDLFPDFDTQLFPSPSWRLLKQYGGELTIEEYRKNLFKIEYIDHHDYTNVFPLCKSVGFIFEKKIKL